MFPITSPSQSRIATSGTTGTAYGDDDATTAGNAIANVYGWVTQFWMPTNGVLHVFLDIEGGTTPSANYVSAWAQTLNEVSFVNNSGNNYPLYPCAYVNPHAATGVCTVVSVCYAIYSSEPEPCSNCNKVFGPAWGAYTCSGLSTVIWQYVQKGPCASTCGNGWTVNVDLDMLNGSSELNHMISTA
jgi:hypothetical protein